MPLCNAGSVLHACMTSIVQQDFKNFELIVVDDRNTTESLKKINYWAKQDSRIKVLANKGKGIVDALNSGLYHARYEYIARMDGDDIMQPDRLSRQWSVMQQNPNLDLLASRVVGFSENGLQKGYRAYLEWQNSLLTHQHICQHMYVESGLAHPSVMFRRSSVMRLGAYRDGDFPEDYELWLRMMQHGCQFAKLPRYLLFWRDVQKRTSRVDPRYRRDRFDALRASYLSQDARLPRHRPFWFWGAGRRTRQRVAGLMRSGITPSAWIDIDPKKIGQKIAGKPVYSPQALCGKDGLANNQETPQFPAGSVRLKKQRMASILMDTPIKFDEKPFIMVLVNNHGAKSLIEAYLQEIGYHSHRDYLLFG